MRRLRWVLVVLLVVAPAPASAEWLQNGHDASRSGFTVDDGPTWNDEALTIKIPTSGPQELRQPSPIIVGDKAYVAGDDTDGMSTIYAVDLLRGTFTIFAEPRAYDLAGADVPYSGVRQLASNGQFLYAFLARGYLYAYDLSDGSEAWTWTVKDAEEVPGSDAAGIIVCPSMELAVNEIALVAACSTSDRSGIMTFRVWRIDPVSGREIWEYDWQTDVRTDPDHVPANVDPSDPTTTTVDSPQLVAETGDEMHVTGLSILADHAYVVVRKDNAANDADEAVPRATAQTIFAALAMDGSEGSTDLVWWETDGLVTDLGTPNWAPAVVGTEDAAYFEGRTLILRPLGDGPDIARVPFRDVRNEGDPASGLSVAPEGVYATSLSTLHLLDHALSPIREFDLPGGTQFGRGSPVRTANDLIIARVGPIDGTHRGWAGSYGGLVAVEARTLRPVWSHTGSVNCTFGVSDGIAVRWCADGVFQVLGTNEASIDVELTSSTAYPRPGDLVRVDMSRTGAGVMGPAQQYRAVWGDGSESDWQEDPVFDHRFVLPTDAQARFFARNGNQSSSQSMVFHVGALDPSKNIFNSPLDAVYQETTFFLLGLIATGAIALIGLYRAGRKRRRLERELRELEAAFKETQADAFRCEAMLAERRARARGLFLQRRLEEAHAAFLITRVDELRHHLRLNEVEQRLDYLPHGMVKSLREMLKDSRITDWERNRFIDVLERDQLLTATQKGQVRKLIDAWFARDAAQTE